MLGQFTFLLLVLGAYGKEDPVPGSAEDWNWNVVMPMQSGYGFCPGGQYTGWSDASSGLEKKCAQWCDAAGTVAGKPKCVGFSARKAYSRLSGFYYHCYNCPSLKKADIDCKCGQCSRKKIGDQPYRIYARKSTKGFNWYYDFEKDGCASDVNPCELGLSATATPKPIAVKNTSMIDSSSCPFVSGSCSSCNACSAKMCTPDGIQCNYLECSQCGWCVHNCAASGPCCPKVAVDEGLNARVVDSLCQFCDRNLATCKACQSNPESKEEIHI